MRFGELLTEQAIDLTLSGVDRDGVIESLIDHLHQVGIISEKETTLNAVLERERALSTGVGQGVAVPHATLHELKSPVVAFARLTEGVEFGSLDGEPVYLVFLLLAPENEISLHLKLLSRVSRLCNKPTFREELMSASDVAGIRDIIIKHEADYPEL